MKEKPQFEPRWFAVSGDDKQSKDIRARVNAYLKWLQEERGEDVQYANIDWLDERYGNVFRPDLETYKLYLLERQKLRPATVNAYIATVRARYRTLLDDGTIAGALHKELAGWVPSDDLRRIIEDVEAEIERAINPSTVQVEMPEIDVQHPCLRAEEIVAVFDRHFRGDLSLTRLRDRAIFALLFATGIRGQELTQLQVEDLFSGVDQTGEPALHVAPGYGSTERWVPYGPLIGARRWTEEWLEEANVSMGPVIRSVIQEAGKVVGDRSVSLRAVTKYMDKYAIPTMYKVRPTDLRRAYARTLYEAGVSLPEIQQRLGVKGGNAVLNYIGGDEAALGLPDGEDPFAYFAKHVFNDA